MCGRLGYNERTRQDLETHVNERWKKKFARLQADMTKVKTQMDELNLKNVALREKLSNASALKDQVRNIPTHGDWCDAVVWQQLTRWLAMAALVLCTQLNELKSSTQRLKSENETLKRQVNSARQKSERADALAESKQVAELTQQVRNSESGWSVVVRVEAVTERCSHDGLGGVAGSVKARAPEVVRRTEDRRKVRVIDERNTVALLAALPVLTRGASWCVSFSCSSSDQVASLLTRQSELDATLAEELQAHSASKVAADALRLEMEVMRSAEAASREENDALISEIDTLAKELEAARQARKKLVHQVDEKRSSNKKLHSQLSKEEQAKAHCFEELAAARLQVSSLGMVHKQQKAYIESVKVRVCSWCVCGRPCSWGGCWD